MENKTKAALLFGSIAAVLLLRKKATPQTTLEKYKFVAAKDSVTAYISPNYNGDWVPDFSKPTATFKKGQTISTTWLGEITLINNEGVKTPFYIVEINLGVFGIAYPVAIKMTDVLRFVV